MSGADHQRTPLLEALQAFRRRQDVVFGPPGHKQGRGVDPRVLDVLGAGVFTSDVLGLNGLDDRRQSQQVLAQAEALMADAVGADHAFFSTCGSSLSVKTAMISVAGPGEKLLISRNAHKSVIAGVILAGIDPVWVHPHFDEQHVLAHPPEPAEVDAALTAHPDAKGMVLITPTDWGGCADIAGVAQVCHRHDVALIVDEAWGAHLPFHPELPVWGITAGADVVVTSVHKMGAAIEQSSVFHLRGDRVDPAVLGQRADLLGTTSPSPLMHASLDGWRRHMVQDGERLLGVALARAHRVREEVTRIDGLELMGREIVRPGGAHDLDPLAVTIDVRGLGVSGYQAGDWARAACHVDLGSCDQNHVNARLTHGDDDHTEARLLDALRRMSAERYTLDRHSAARIPPLPALQLETAMLPRDAFFGPTEQIPVDRAPGRVAAEMLSPYPPGVPVLAPGEVITAEVLEYLTTGVPAGMLVPDAADPTLATVRVVA